MAQTLHVDQIDNLSIAFLDARGNPTTATFDAPATWTLTDSSASGAVLTPAADGNTATLTPGTVGATVTVNLSGAIGGTTYSATLDVSFVSGAVASIQIVANAVPATPAPTPASPPPAA